MESKNLKRSHATRFGPFVLGALFFGMLSLGAWLRPAMWPERELLIGISPMTILMFTLIFVFG